MIEIIRELFTEAHMAVLVASAIIGMAGIGLAREMYLVYRDMDAIGMYGRKTVYTGCIVAALLLLPILNIVAAAALIGIFCVQELIVVLSGVYKEKRNKIRRR